MQPYFNFTAPEQALSIEMAGYWGAFTASGNPNLGGAFPIWSAYNGTIDNTLVFETQSTAPQNGIESVTCDFWDKMGYSS